MKRLLPVFVTMLTLFAPSKAWTQTQYISEVMLIGKNNNTEVNTLKEQYVAQGWTAIEQDLNKGCGSASDYIYLLYKTRSTASPNHTFITNFYISDESGDAPETLDIDTRHYTLVPYDGDNHFKEKRGDLNSHAGGKDIHLYYTTDRMWDYAAIGSITFNATKSGAVQEYDLNKGAGGDDIYMHCERNNAPYWVIEKSNDGSSCIIKGYNSSKGLPKSDVLACPAIIDGAVVVDISGFNFMDYPYLETIYFSQDYNANTIPEPFITDYWTFNLKHVHIVDNSGAVVKADELPASITSIPANGFLASSIETLKMPNVTSIGEKAFIGCIALTSVTMPNVTSIGKNAFYNCKKLTSVTLNSNPAIGDGAFPSGTTVTMNLTANTAEGAKWMTFYNKGYNFQADANTQVFKTELSGTTITLHEVTDKIVNASTGVVLKSTGNPVMTLTTSASSNTDANSLKGVADVEGATSDGTYYVLNYKETTGVGFYKLANGRKLGLGKAYLQTASSSNFFGLDDETTNISLTPTLSKGEGAWFDLSGRKLTNPKKGIYIHNGRKEVLK